jgi:AraC-like DNA-binding protein
LSQKLDIPEYRLRHLINRQLGHRNFSAFVNSYRLAEAEAALSDPSQVAVPILTIALDAGFGSIGPFNRAFKAHTGLTPSEYRRARAGGEAGAEPSPFPDLTGFLQESASPSSGIGAPPSYSRATHCPAGKRLRMRGCDEAIDFRSAILPSRRDRDRDSGGSRPGPGDAP